MIRKLKQWRFLLILFSLIATSVACFLPKFTMQSDVYHWLVMVDITRSMNATDYKENNRPVSRLEKVKAELVEVLNKMPCGSTLGLGVFAERAPAILFMPMEVCDNYPLIETTVNQLDWRMAWVADSNIARALNNTLSLMDLPDLKNAKLLFITDGHEAPPVNPDYEPDFNEYRTNDEPIPGAVRLANQQSAAMNNPVEFTVNKDRRYGLLVGVGGLTPTRIPKFNEDGHHEGFYTVDDVPHAARFGLPKDPSKIPGYVPRNAEWGSEAPKGTEHLTFLKEEYLKSLSQKASMGYLSLNTAKNLFTAITHDDFLQRTPVLTWLGYIPGTVALFFLCLFYVSGLRVFMT